MPGLLGFPCVLKEPGLPWSDGLFLNPGLLGMPGLLEAACLKMFCFLLFCLFRSSLLIGAPTSSGVFILLSAFFVLGLVEFWFGLFDGCLVSPGL